MGAPLGIPVQIAGTGHHVPAQQVTSEEMDARLGLALGTVEGLAGVRTRFVCDGEDQISLATEASRRAMDQAGVGPADIDLVLGGCAVPYQPLPATAPLVMRALGIADGQAEAFDVNSTCLSFLSAFHLAATKIATGQSQTALVFASEIASRALPWDDQPDVAALFSDGAAAAVLTRSKEGGSRILASRFRTFPAHYEACEIGAGGTRIDYHKAPADFAAHAVFRMDGKQLFRATFKAFPEFVSGLMGDVGWRPEDIDLMVPHQASPLALRHIVSALGLSSDQVIDITETYGNQIAASIPTALDIALREGRAGAGSKVLILGTSAGISFGGVALEL